MTDKANNGKKEAGNENLKKIPSLTIKPPPLTPRPTATVTVPLITTPRLQ
ncbi:hypothetical protein [Morganella morganii]|uniref:Uncharacterized protein n=1 Tax=Morganella morganii TaxID=582 RepID=A0A9Q4GUF3_MORMO|nr:hypothetical protein [Morganella morganii]BEP20499.1 hypothetical protein SUGSMm_12960 [Morganella morganii subsp. sibonii]EJD6037796.1 hypothetical protein [Morganella morganii]EJD6040926.1 hypothetical protein [Morganella morganii]EKK5376210.1 hypothetical protein [Morganella morganii]EKK5378697.1 hypothetical protein [Morganella morganii]